MSEHISAANDFRLALYSRLMNHGLAAQETDGPQNKRVTNGTICALVSSTGGFYLWFDYLSQLDPFSFHGVAFHD